MKAIVRNLTYKANDVFTIKPCFDWHVGAAECDVAAIRKYLKADENNPNAFILGGGDMAQAIVVSDKKRYTKSADGTRQSRSDKIINDQLNQLEDLLSPYKGRILGLGTGNHELDILKRSSFHIMDELAVRLETISLGYQWAVTLRFTHKSGGRGRSLVLFGHHGWGGGSRTAGGSITKYARHASEFEADIFFYGHDHKREAHVTDFMGIHGDLFIPKQRRIFFPGTFQRTFADGDEPTWAETRGFTPVTLKGLNVYIQITGSGPTTKNAKLTSAFPFTITSDL